MSVGNHNSAIGGKEQGIMLKAIGAMSIAEFVAEAAALISVAEALALLLVMGAIVFALYCAMAIRNLQAERDDDLEYYAERGASFGNNHAMPRKGMNMYQE